jgi:hypothetical protein
MSDSQRAGGPMSVGRSTRVLPFPVPADHAPPPILVWWRCAGGCDRLVTSPLALCLTCAAREDHDG